MHNFNEKCRLHIIFPKNFKHEAAPLRAPPNVASYQWLGYCAPIGVIKRSTDAKFSINSEADLCTRGKFIYRSGVDNIASK
jgi:hypothetical protein